MRPERLLKVTRMTVGRVNCVFDQRNEDNSMGKDCGNTTEYLNLLAEWGRGMLGRRLVHYPGFLDLSYNTARAQATMRCYPSGNVVDMIHPAKSQGSNSGVKGNADITQRLPTTEGLHRP